MYQEFNIDEVDEMISKCRRAFNKKIKIALVGEMFIIENKIYFRINL
tara:strand:+ start:928 stop:1068 length:141 start_codon:yes stop_codon:yes gene_type:complete